MAATSEILAFGDIGGRRMKIADFVGTFGAENYANQSLFVFDSTLSELFDGHDGGFESSPPRSARSQEFEADTDSDIGQRGAFAGDFVTPKPFRSFLKGERVGWNMLSLADSGQGLVRHCIALAMTLLLVVITPAALCHWVSIGI